MHFEKYALLFRSAETGTPFRPQTLGIFLKMFLGFFLFLLSLIVFFHASYQAPFHLPDASGKKKGRDPLIQVGSENL